MPTLPEFFVSAPDIVDGVNIPYIQNSYYNWIIPSFFRSEKTSSERPVYDLLTREVVCTGAKKEDVLKYGEKKMTFKKQMNQEADEELRRLSIERGKYRFNSW